MNDSFEHEDLDAYRVAIEFMAWADTLASKPPPGRAYLGDQLHRAASSIVLNTAEGAGEFAPKDKARFYRMARRSATECAAILDVWRFLQPIDDKERRAARHLLLRIVAMLTGLVVNPSQQKTGSGSGSGSGSKTYEAATRSPAR